LLRSSPGIGAIVATALIVRMPELGRLKRGQAAAPIGVAPLDRDSGAHQGKRSITGAFNQS
jgi:transposase